MSLIKGIEIIDQFLKIDQHNNLLDSLEKLKYNLINQERVEHYNHVFHMEGKYYPKKNEIYSSKFNQLNEISINTLNLDDFLSSIVNIISLKYNNKYKYFSKPVIAKLSEGCYYRLHMDTYAGKIGYTYFINREWIYDNGGLLNFIDSNSNIYPIIPLSNRLIIRQEENILPHFLSSVEKWASSDQYIIIGWINDIPINEGGIIKDYTKLID